MGFHLRILNSQLQVCKLKMDLKLLISGVFCILVNQSQALEWTPGNENQFTWEVPASQASIWPGQNGVSDCEGNIRVKALWADNVEIVMNIDHTLESRNKWGIDHIRPNFTLVDKEVLCENNWTLLLENMSKEQIKRGKC